MTRRRGREATSAEDGFELVECAPGLGVGLMRPDRGDGIVVQPLFDSFAGQAFAALHEGFESVGVELGGARTACLRVLP